MYHFTLSSLYRKCPESLRWLIANGKTEEAMKILQGAAKFNNVPPLPKDILEQGEVTKIDKENKPTFLKMIKNTRTLSYMLIMLYLM